MKALTLNHDGYARSAPDSVALTDLSEFVTLNDIDEPKPKSGEIKVKLAAVNPSDEMLVQGLYGQPRIGGNAAGFEGVGEVVASGGGLAEGQARRLRRRQTGMPRFMERICHYRCGDLHPFEKESQ